MWTFFPANAIQKGPSTHRNSNTACCLMKERKRNLISWGFSFSLTFYAPNFFLRQKIKLISKGFCNIYLSIRTSRTSAWFCKYPNLRPAHLRSLLIVLNFPSYRLRLIRIRECGPHTSLWKPAALNILSQPLAVSDGSDDFSLANLFHRSLNRATMQKIPWPRIPLFVNGKNNEKSWFIFSSFHCAFK